MKKLTAILAASALCMSMFSCSSEGGKTPQEISVEKLSDKTYKRTRMELPEEIVSIYNIRSFGSGEKLFVVAGSMEKTPAFYIADKSFTSFTPLDIPEFSIGYAYDVNVADDGSVISIVNEVDYGGLPEPDPYAADYDEKLYEENSVYSLVVNKYSPDGELISSNELTEIYDTVDPDGVMITGIFCPDGENCVVKLNNKYYAIGVDGSFRGEIKADSADKSIEYFGCDREGNIVCAVDCGVNKLKFCKMNAASASLEKSSTTYTFNDGMCGNILPGTGEYTMYIPSRGSIYGVKSDGTIEAVFDVSSSGANPNILGNAYLSETGELYLSDGNFTGSGVKLYHYAECDPSELEEKKTITIATLNNDLVLADMLVPDINDSQDEFYVQLKDYSSFNTDGNPYGAREQLSLDLISGDSPDIIFLSGFGYTDFASMGAICDLYEFMDKDPDFGRSKFNENFLTLAEKEGKLYYLPQFVYYNAAYGKTKYVGDKENWNVEDFINACENRPEGMRIDQYGQPRGYIGYEGFIDLENGTCSFDSEEFITLLEYIENLPPEESEPLYNLTPEHFENPALEEEREIIVKQQQGVFRNDEVMLGNTYTMIGSFADYFDRSAGESGGDEITFVGEITPNGTGITGNLNNMFGISSQCKDKETAWECLKLFFTEDIYDHTSGGFPTVQSELESYEMEALAPQSYSDTDYTGYYWHGVDPPLELGMPTQEDVDRVWEIINTTTTVENHLPDEVWEVIFDELAKLDAGECTPRECAEMMQNRCSIMVAEIS